MLMRGSKGKAEYENLTDEEILNIRIKDLNVQIADSPLEPLINRLYDELGQAGISFRPPRYLADEWLCPDKLPIIGIPFYLAHPRLKHIEKKMMFEVEGGTEKSCMKLLRHECGHAFNYAYELYKKTRWRKLFGTFSTTYSISSYFSRRYSKRYVVHLQGNYAQSHPDEDFAETFAVCITPNSQWQQKYNKWPAIKKLQYVDGLIKRTGSTAPVKTFRGTAPWSAHRMTSTLGAYYQRRQKLLGDEFRGYYDEGLKRLFIARPVDAELCASKFIRGHRKLFVNHIAKWTGSRKYEIYHLLNRLARRCEVLDLWARPGDEVAISTFVTAIVSNALKKP